MKSHGLSSTGQIVFLVIIIFVMTGCAAPTPTPFVLTPESPTAPAQPQAASLQVALTASQSLVRVLLGNDPEQALQQFETTNIPVGGQITVDESGRGVMRFGDRHEIDLFGATEVVVDDAKLESGGSIFVRLQQIYGHTHILLNERSVARVTVETGDATITTLEQGTEFAVCYNPEKVNCIAVQRGAVEITSQGEKRIYREGEATFFEPGQPPQPPFCVPQEDFDAWLIQKRSPDDPGPLSVLVQSSPQGPCGTSTSEPSAAEDSSPTPTRTATSTATSTVTVSPTPTPTHAITLAPSASPTSTREPRQPQPPTDTEQPPTEPAATEPPPSDTPVPPWIPTDTEEPPTEPPATEQPPPSDTP